MGVGRMGANMARRLKDCGYEVSAVYDIHAKPPTTWPPSWHRMQYARRSPNCRRHHHRGDRRLRCAPFLRRRYSLLTGAEGRVFINCATISPAVHVDEGLAKAAGAESSSCMAGAHSPDARRREGHLRQGGTARQTVRQQTLRRHLRQGGPGCTGDMVMNINTAGLAEGLSADALGLDLNMVMEIFSQTGANSRVLETDGEDMRDRDHECYLRARNQDPACAGAWTSGGAESADGRSLWGQFDTMIERASVNGQIRWPS